MKRHHYGIKDRIEAVREPRVIRWREIRAQNEWHAIKLAEAAHPGFRVDSMRLVRWPNVWRVELWKDEPA